MSADIEYVVQCWNCLGEFEAVGAVWCGCSTVKPTKICPFCMTCFCAADPVYLSHFWSDAPETLKTEVTSLGRARQRLGDLMVKEGAVSEEQIQEALRRQQKSGERLGEALVGLGAIDAETLEKFLRVHQGTVPADLRRASIQPALIQRVGVDRCYDKVVLPLEIQELGRSSILTLAMADPSDSATVQEIADHTACRVIAEFAERDEILEILRNTFPREEGGSGAPTVKQVRKMLLDWVSAATGKGASHIHVQSGRVQLRVFLRIDGVVYLVKRYPKKFHPYLMREVRGLVHHPEGQPFAQGRTLVKLGGGTYELRVTVRRTEHGEDVAVRVVNVDTFGRDLEAEVPDTRIRNALESGLSAPGLTVIGSPLYHGRIDTAYALMWRQRRAGRKIRSYERQITCPLPGVEQVELSPPGLAPCLARLKGSDPVFLIDLLTGANVEAVIQAAQERPVLATVASKGVVPLLGCLLDAVEAERLSRTLHAVTGQRQVRLLCEDCRIEDEDATASVYLGLEGQEEGKALRAMKSIGCPGCEERGHRGRTTLFEFLPVQDSVEAMMAAGVPAEVLFQEGSQKGGSSLRMAFIESVRAGRISLAEFEKVSL